MLEVGGGGEFWLGLVDLEAAVGKRIRLARREQLNRNCRWVPGRCGFPLVIGSDR